MNEKQIGSSGTEYRIACPFCGARLSAKPKLAGRQLACPKCNGEFIVPSPPDTSPLPPPEPPLPTADSKPAKRIPPTEKQIAFATELGVEFAEDIDRRDLSKLIDAAIIKRDDERFQRLDEIQEKENQVREELRAEIMAECDQEDPRLSVATSEQIVESLDQRMIGGILLTFSYDELGGFENFEELVGKSVHMNHTDDVDTEDVIKILMWVSTALRIRSGHESE